MSSNLNEITLGTLGVAKLGKGYVFIRLIVLGCLLGRKDILPEK
jgi:hypothetical protein